MFMLNGWSQSGKLCTVQSMLCKMVYKYTNSYTCIWCSDFGTSILFNVHKYSRIYTNQQVLFDLPPTATKESNHRTKELVKNENKMKCQSRSEKGNSIFKNCERIDWKILLLRKGHFDLYIRISFFFTFQKLKRMNEQLRIFWFRFVQLNEHIFFLFPPQRKNIICMLLLSSTDFYFFDESQFHSMDE